MADKSTVTMWHKEATEPIEVLPSGVANAKSNGWTDEKPVDEAAHVTVSSKPVEEKTESKPKGKKAKKS